MTRQLHSDMHGNVLAKIANTETCVALDHVTRLALLKLLGGFSRNDYAARSLSNHEAIALDHFWRTLRS